MWKTPHRPTDEVTQQFNSGIVAIFSVADSASPGKKPIKSLVAKESLRYEELRLGINRYYSSKQNQVDVERVVRVPRRPGVSSQDVAITEDGEQYEIAFVQTTTDIWPPSMDLTLSKIEQKYEVLP